MSDSELYDPLPQLPTARRGPGRPPKRQKNNPKPVSTTKPLQFLTRSQTTTSIPTHSEEVTTSVLIYLNFIR